MNNNVKHVADKVFQKVIMLKQSQKKIINEFQKSASKNNKDELRMGYQVSSALIAAELESLEHLLVKKKIVAQKGCTTPKTCRGMGYTMTKCLT